MGQDQLGILLLATPVISFVMLFVLKGVAQRVYNQTGYNAIDSTNLLLIKAMVIVPAIIGVAMSFVDSRANDFLIAGAILVVILVILAVKNLKAKNPAYIVILTLLQLLSGVAFFVATLVSFALRLIFRNTQSVLGADLIRIKTKNNDDIEKDLRDYVSAGNYAAADSCAEQLGYKNADEYATASGYTSKEWM